MTNGEWLSNLNNTELEYWSSSAIPSETITNTFKMLIEQHKDEKHWVLNWLKEEYHETENSVEGD